MDKLLPSMIEHIRYMTGFEVSLSLADAKWYVYAPAEEPLTYSDFIDKHLLKKRLRKKNKRGSNGKRVKN